MGRQSPNSTSDVLCVQPNTLPEFAYEERDIGFMLYGSSLSGLILPLIGNLMGPYIVYRTRGKDTRVMRVHWASIRRSQLRWGIAMAIVYGLCSALGPKCLPLALAVVIPWAVYVAIAACQAEDGRSVQRLGPWT
jgi:hypothetical protein